MTLARTNPSGWAANASFTSAQANTMDTTIAAALDRTVAGDTLSGVIRTTGAGRVSLRQIVGADAATTYGAGDADAILVSGNLTAQRTYTISTTGAGPGDRIFVFANSQNTHPVTISGVVSNYQTLTVGNNGLTTWVALMFVTFPDTTTGWIVSGIGPLLPSSDGTTYGLWYKCNELSGTLGNSGSIGTAPLTLTGTTQYGVAAPTSAGVLSGTGQFSGATGLALYNTTITIACTFSRAITSTNSQSLFGRYETYPAGFRLYHDTSGIICASIQGTFGSATLSSGVAVTNGAWYHVALTYDGSNAKLYVNGVLLVTQAAVGTLQPTGSDVWAIGDGAAAQILSITDCRTINVALNSSQVGQLAVSSMRWNV